MRTIIINTLGEELQPDPLFFLPYRKEELLWIHTDLQKLASCAQEISLLLQRFSTIQSYHLVLLADLTVFDGTEYEHLRDALKELMSAWFYHVVLMPLTEFSVSLPSMVSEVFLYSGRKSGEHGIPQEELYRHVFKIDKLNSESDGLFVEYYTNREKNYLDMTGLFCVPWEYFCKKTLDIQIETSSLDGSTQRSIQQLDPLIRPETDPAEQYKKEKEQEILEGKRNQLRENITNQIKTMQHYRLPRGGKREPLEIDPNIFLFPVEDDYHELVMVDLQINISRMMESTRRWNGKGTLPHFTINSHSQEEIKEQFRIAELRLEYLIRHIPPQKYYPLKAELSLVNISEAESDIRRELINNHANLLGVRACNSITEGGKSSEDDLLIKIKKCWFRLGEERRQFQELFGQFHDQYDSEYVRREQDEVMDSCLTCFRKWRMKTLNSTRNHHLNENEATETVMPELGDVLKENQDLLEANQERFTQTAADHLEDYEDIREEGIRIHEEFEKQSRFWSPDAFTKNYLFFRIFSGIMAIIFIMLMILPYVLIEAGTVGHGISRVVVFGVSLVCFIILYLLGLLWWLRQMCKRLHNCSVKLANLLVKSSKRRAESVENQVQVYGEVLPECIRLSEKIEMLSMIDKENQRKQRWRLYHEHLLDRALTRLLNLRTSLRIAAPVGELSDKEISRLDLKPELAPYEADNREIYLFFTEPVSGEGM